MTLKSVKSSSSLASQVLLLTLCMIPTAHADLFGLWVKGKSDYVTGSGEVFKRFEGQLANGLEAGIELFGLSFWGDAEFMSESQYWASANVGIDFSFGDELELTLGAYGGLVFFGFPDSGSEDSGTISSAQQQQITDLLPAGVSYSDFESKYNEFFGAEDQLSDTAFGLNGRLRLSLEYHIAPAFSIGVQGSAGYHIITSGEEAASGLKSKSIDAFVASQSIPDASVKAELKSGLKEALGAEEVNVDDLKGINYSAGAFVSLSF